MDWPAAVWTVVVGFLVVVLWFISRTLERLLTEVQRLRQRFDKKP